MTTRNFPLPPVETPPRRRLRGVVRQQEDDKESGPFARALALLGGGDLAQAQAARELTRARPVPAEAPPIRPVGEILQEPFQGEIQEPFMEGVFPGEERGLGAFLQAFYERVGVPAGALLSTTLSQAIPGPEGVQERRARELRAQGVGPFEAARQASAITPQPWGAKALAELVVDPLNLAPGIGFGGPLAHGATQFARRGVPLTREAFLAPARLFTGLPEGAGAKPPRARAPRLKPAGAGEEIPPTPEYGALPAKVPEAEMLADDVRMMNRAFKTELRLFRARAKPENGPYLLSGKDQQGRTIRMQGDKTFIRGELDRMREEVFALEAKARAAEVARGQAEMLPGAKSAAAKGLQVIKESPASLGEAPLTEAELLTRDTALVEEARNRALAARAPQAKPPRVRRAAPKPAAAPVAPPVDAAEQEMMRDALRGYEASFQTIRYRIALLDRSRVPGVTAEELMQFDREIAYQTKELEILTPKIERLKAALEIPKPPPTRVLSQEAQDIERRLQRRRQTTALNTPIAAPKPAPGAVPPPAPPAAGQALPPAPAAPVAAAAPPPVKPPGGAPPGAAGAPPPANPISPRPRTLADMNREAKGMRAMTPEQRAAVMDLAEPITGDILYQARPFNEHARILLGPDTGFIKALRGVPGLKQVFGVWSPAQMTRDNPVAMIGLRQSIFQEVEKARIRFATLRWWHDADEAFGFKQTETARGLKPTTGIWRAQKVQAAPGVVKGKMFGTINDMVEHPERYIFDADQQRVLDIADATLTQSVRDAQRAGVNVVELAAAYWPRAIIKGPKGKRGGFASLSRRVGSGKGYTHQRVFADIDDLVAPGFEVETDPRRVFSSRLEAGVDTIAHQNSRNQIKALPGVVKPLERMEQRFPEVLQSASDARTARDVAKQVVVKAGPKATPAEVLAMRQAEADYITAMREVFAKKVEAGQPGYYELRLPNGRIAPQELVEEVGKFIDLPELRQGGVGVGAEVIREVSQLLRTTLTNVDLAAGFIQGQALFYRNNPVWWKAQAHAITALVDDPTAWVAKNWDIIDEGVRAGAIVAPTEFLFAKQGLASIPLRIPYAGPALGSFNRAFEWYITVGQTELYKAARSGKYAGVGMDELASLGSAIRKEVGTESYAILGVRPNQRTMEALTLFAARFFRANVGLLGQSFTRGPGGAEARKAVGALIAGGLSLTIGINALKGRPTNLTDPYAPDWMQTRQGGTYFSAFGPFYPYFRTLARVGVSLAAGEPMKAAMEIKRFLSSKESLPLRAIDITGQLIYYGTAYVYGTKIEKKWLSILKGILSEFVTPISAQEIPSGIAEGRPESVLEFIGLIGRPVRRAKGRSFPVRLPRLRPTSTQGTPQGAPSGLRAPVGAGR